MSGANRRLILWAGVGSFVGSFATAFTVAWVTR